ncbi:MAG TPA: hypothetical protein VK797_21035, partial [Tepidisphaeraceae bacterium]|nr:hypothetical protein [Tepidisphaeraceae bacterium]
PAPQPRTITRLDTGKANLRNLLRQATAGPNGINKWLHFLRQCDQWHYWHAIFCAKVGQKCHPLAFASENSRTGDQKGDREAGGLVNV